MQSPPALLGGRMLTYECWGTPFSPQQHPSIWGAFIELFLGYYLPSAFLVLSLEFLCLKY